MHARVDGLGPVHEHRAELRPQSRSGAQVLARAHEDHAWTLDGEVLREAEHLLGGGALAAVDGRCDEDDALDECRMPRRDLDSDLGSHRVADHARPSGMPRARRNAATRSAVRSIVSTRARFGCLAVARQVDRDRPRRTTRAPDACRDPRRSCVPCRCRGSGCTSARRRSAAPDDLGDERRTRVRKGRDVAHLSRLAAFFRRPPTARALTSGRTRPPGIRLGDSVG